MATEDFRLKDRRLHPEGCGIASWPPLAHLMRVRRETYEAPWGYEEERVNRDSPEANRVFEYYVQFNEKKFAHGGKHQRVPDDPSATKDSTTYYRERRRVGRLA